MAAGVDSWRGARFEYRGARFDGSRSEGSVDLDSWKMTWRNQRLRLGRRPFMTRLDDDGRCLWSTWEYVGYLLDELSIQQASVYWSHESWYFTDSF